uniref:Ubiquitin-associated and SH3 domain-containing protein A n=1 Tax=Jaculus jaculus TaxID=51337 RepID=A0A8C5L1W7_JACJA
MATGETQLYAKVSSKHKGRSSTPSLLDPLLAMGFPVHTVLKALAATGRKTTEEAAQLRGHRSDPSLDDPIPQEYALFLCPTGSLLEKLQEFWRESRRQCARNRAHEVFPHVTLCDFFTCEDEKVEGLYEALRRAGDRVLGSFPTAVPLELHASISYLGFFINDSPADVIREFAMTFATDASILAGTVAHPPFMPPGGSHGPCLKLGRLGNLAAAQLVEPCLAFMKPYCTVKPNTKQLHLTLAHKFYPHHQRTLEQLARAIQPDHTCRWTAALYSRDMRFVHYQTLKVLFQYKPQNADELMLCPGDYIFVDPTQQEEASEGWAIGTSQRTGCRGFLPENYTERASEADTWVRHRRGVLVVRHGEGVDWVFGKSWLQRCSTADGKYYRPDLNFPRSLPTRSNGIKDFENDPPLSSCGAFQSRLAGEALLESGVRISAVFASPALRCVQTAKHILEELKLERKLKIKVEPGIFEWTKWEASKSTPTFMTLEELKEANFNVDPDYRPAFPRCSLMPGESYNQYTERCAVSMGQILGACPHDVGVTLIVSHGSALDSCTRPLLGLRPRDCADFAQLVRKIPSLGMCFCEENREEGKWELVNPPVKTLTHGANSAFNWRNWISGN